MPRPKKNAPSTNTKRKRVARPRKQVALSPGKPADNGAAAHFYASQIARHVFPSHPIAYGVGHGGGNTTGPSMAYSKTVRAIVTSAGTLSDYIVFRPGPSNNLPDVYIRQGTTTRTPNEVVATPDSAFTGVGSLFPDTSFLDGQLEWRLVGGELTITPISNRLNCSGAMSYCVIVEDSDVSTDQIDAILARDRRTRNVPKVPGVPIETHICEQFGSTETYIATMAFSGRPIDKIVARIPNDSGVAAQYLVEAVVHIEVAGTTVGSHGTHKPYDEPAYRRVNRSVQAHHHDAGAKHYTGWQRAEDVASRMGLSFKKLISEASHYGKTMLSVGGAATAANQLARVAGSAAMRYALPAARTAAPLLLTL